MDVVTSNLFADSHSFVYGEFIGTGSDIRGKSTYYYLNFHCQPKNIAVSVDKSEYMDPSPYGHVILMLSPDVKIFKTEVADYEKRKFMYPVEYRKSFEYGNDSYDYCVVEPYIALNNFGLHRVTKVIENADTVLYYRNHDSNIDSVSYRLVDSLQNADNRAKVRSSCAFLFQDGVYTQEHVFTEIPQAKEYYLKYCKEVDIVK
ncbi:MAG: hypothetical protein IKQ46_17750 [Bacteroidales bacterium]|nr:hypothetical protein [Bacteroidales bacterium]